MLDIAKERLESGEYVRVANALKTASETSQAIVPVRVITNRINNYISFNTLQGDIMHLVVMNQEKIVYAGATPNVYNVTYSLNGIVHTEEKDSFVNKMVNVMNCVGMVKIQRDYFVKYYYENMYAFKKDIMKANAANEGDDDDDMGATDEYTIVLFLGLNGNN